MSHRFCPKYPEISFYSTHDQLLKNSQKDFFAIDLASTATDITKGEESFLVKTSVFDSDKNILSRVADTYDYNDRALKNGYMGEGAPVITFSNQLKYGTFPFAKAISKILKLGEKAMGSSVEIEFAGNFHPFPKKRTTFYLLQIRPFIEQDELLVFDPKDKDGSACIFDKEGGFLVHSGAKIPVTCESRTSGHRCKETAFPM